MTVSLVEWGCNIYTLLDCDNGIVYGFTQGGLEVSVHCLAAWLEQWLDGTLAQPFAHGKDAEELQQFTETEWARFRARRFSDQ